MGHNPSNIQESIMTQAFTILISPEELAAHLDDPAWVVVDCRHQLLDHSYGRREYESGHIPGARFAEMEDDLSGVKTGRNGRHPLPDWDDFRAWLSSQGIGNGSQVIAYDDVNGVFASRLWHMLRMLGHEAVAVLDGGITAWETLDLPVDTALPRITPATFNGEPDLTMLASLEEVIAMAKDPGASGSGKTGALLVDARNATRYRGEEEPVDPRPGHIPGAINLFFADNVNADGTFKSPQMLRVRFLEGYKEISPEQSIHYCGSGVSACHNILAQAVAGLPLGRLYPGSWSEWCAAPEREAATGDTPFSGASSALPPKDS